MNVPDLMGIISGKEFYVCDFKGHCVVVFSEEGKFLRRIGCENITNFPNGIDVSDAGDVLIGDSHGNKFHVAVFSREGTLITEFECPYVKVCTVEWECFCRLCDASEGIELTLSVAGVTLLRTEDYFGGLHRYLSEE